MNFPAAVRSSLSQYAVFSGRARRSEFWWFALFTGLITTVAALLDQAVDGRFVQAATSLALLLPSLAVSVRRLHDTGRSGWWWFVVLVPVVGWAILLGLQCGGSERAENRFGPAPAARFGATQVLSR